MILILSHPDDPHARAVLDHLGRMGAPAQILDPGRFPGSARMVLRYDAQSSQLGWSDDDGTVIDLDAVEAVWWRRPQRLSSEPGLRTQDSAAPDCGASDCGAALAGLWQAMPAVWMNPPLLEEAASRKSWQLRLAGQLGLDPPDTIITTCPQTARAFIARRGDVICKPVADSQRPPNQTCGLRAADLAQIEQLRHAPAILQQRIEGRDIRVTVVGRQVFAAEIAAGEDRPARHHRMNDNVTIRPATLPQPTVAAIHILMEYLGLTYSALDFRRQPDGQLRFLGINPAGQFLFVEEQTGQPIARAMAGELMQMAGLRAAA